MSTRKPSQPLRYVVELWDCPELVGYHCSLGTVYARRCALHTARQYGGRVLVEYTDGTMDEVMGYGARPVPEAQAAA